MFEIIARNLVRGPSTMTGPEPNAASVASIAARIDRTMRLRLGRSLAIRHVDAGSCNGCELEISALNSPIYDLERFGLSFVASPRHADVLLVTGPVTTNMQAALRAAYEAMPSPKWVLAVGQCAVDGGLFADSYAVVGGANRTVPVDMVIPGCPPRPIDILAALLILIEAEATRPIIPLDVEPAKDD